MRLFEILDSMNSPTQDFDLVDDMVDFILNDQSTYNKHIAQLVYDNNPKKIKIVPIVKHAYEKYLVVFKHYPSVQKLNTKLPIETLNSICEKIAENIRLQVKQELHKKAQHKETNAT